MAKVITSRGQNIAVALMAVVILGFCFYGFGSKFIEFLYLVLSDDEAAAEGVFAVTPVLNYLLASMGFLCLLGWAATHGMFHNIEQPKQTMLEVDAWLDADNDDSQFTRSVLE
jgi:hypothetical protein